MLVHCKVPKPCARTGVQYFMNVHVWRIFVYVREYTYWHY